MRGRKREFISRCYNLLLRTTLQARFSDAQCGFKAMRTECARALLPHVHDTAWFFDTELLVLAERSGLRIAEVPVDWVDDPDSRVDIVATAMADLRGIARLGRALARGELPVRELRAQIGREQIEVPGVSPRLAVQAMRFAAVGVLSTLAYLLLFLLIRALAGRAGGELQRAADHRGREHRGEPALHVRRARRRGRRAIRPRAWSSSASAWR